MLAVTKLSIISDKSITIPKLTSKFVFLLFFFFFNPLLSSLFFLPFNSIRLGLLIINSKNLVISMVENFSYEISMALVGGILLSSHFNEISRKFRLNSIFFFKFMVLITLIIFHMKIFDEK